MLKIDPETYYSFQEIADIFNVKFRTVQGWIRAGKFPAVRVGQTPYVSGKNLIKLLEKKD